jgi:hypothetical protein
MFDSQVGVATMRILERWRKRMEQLKTAVFGTKRIRLTRSIVLDGGEGKEGEILDLPTSQADDLIRMGSAVTTEASATKRQEPARAKVEMRKVKLLRSINLGEVGTIHEVPVHVAFSLIEEKSAEPHGWRVKPDELNGWTTS